MIIPEKFKTITKTSKVLALILFIFLPFIGFILGMGYEKMITKSKQSEELSSCTKELDTTHVELQKVYREMQTKEVNKEPVITNSDNELPSQDIEGLLSLLKSPINWSEYSNKQCGFSMKYPDFLKVDERNCEVAFYYGDIGTNYSFCPLIHLILNNQSCGSLAYKGTAKLTNTVEAKVGDFSVKRYDYAIDGLVLESSFDELNLGDNNISISYYNGGETSEQANKIREIFDQMVLSIKSFN